MASISVSTVARRGSRLITSRGLVGGGQQQQPQRALLGSPRLQWPPQLCDQYQRTAICMNHHYNFFSTSAAASAEVVEDPVVVTTSTTTNTKASTPSVDESTTETTATATTNKKKKKKRRRVLAAKDPIIVTERAADRIKELLSGQNAEGAMGIILGVKRRGCNGLSYTMNYAFEEPKDAGASMKAHGVQFYIEPMALFNVVGTKMDWEEDELTSEFTFNNPNSKGECGCGESFNV